MIKFRVAVVLLLLLNITLHSREVILDFEPEGELSSELVVFTPFNKGVNVDQEIADYFYSKLVTEFVRENKYRPVSIENWYYDNYKDFTFSSVDKFLEHIVTGRMSVDKICWGDITVIEGEYLFTFYWYDIKSKKKTMYQRFFRLKDKPVRKPNINPEGIALDPSMVPEMPEFAMPEVAMPEVPEIPEVEMPEFEAPEVELPEFDLAAFFGFESEEVVEEEPVDPEILALEERNRRLDEVIASLLKEYKNRNEKLKKKFSTSILVKKTKVSYFMFSALSSGEEEFSSVPFIQYKDTPLSNNEDFYSSLFEYSFYKTGLVNEKSDKFGNYLRKETPVQYAYNYIVDTELLVSSNFAVLKVKVINPNVSLKNPLIEYSYPIQGIEFDNLQVVADKNTQMILLHVLNDKAMKRVGIIDLENAATWSNGAMVSLDKKSPGHDPVVFINDIYCGNLSRLSTQIMYYGQNSIIKDNAEFRIFVSPYWINEIYFTPSDGILLEK